MVKIMPDDCLTKEIACALLWNSASGVLSRPEG